MLASASLGAIWSSCSPDFGARGVRRPLRADRAASVLFAPTATRTRASASIRCARVAEIRRELAVARARRDRAGCRERAGSRARSRGAVLWDDCARAASRAREPAFPRLPFDHPLYILYSSGTTGVPKCIVHGAGGTLLQHVKEHLLHVDLKPGDRALLLHDARLDDVELAGVGPRLRARRSCSTTARPSIRTRACSSTSPSASASPSSAPRPSSSTRPPRPASSRRRRTISRRCARCSRPARRSRPRASTASTRT